MTIYYLEWKQKHGKNEVKFEKVWASPELDEIKEMYEGLRGRTDIWDIRLHTRNNLTHLLTADELIEESGIDFKKVLHRLPSEYPDNRT